MIDKIKALWAKLSEAVKGAITYLCATLAAWIAAHQTEWTTAVTTAIGAATAAIIVGIANWLKNKATK